MWQIKYPITCREREVHMIGGLVANQIAHLVAGFQRCAQSSNHQAAGFAQHHE